MIALFQAHNGVVSIGIVGGTASGIVVNRVDSEEALWCQMAFEHNLSALLRDVGRQIMAWALSRLEPANDNEVPSQVEYRARLYRRRQHPNQVAMLFGLVKWDWRLYESLGSGLGHVMDDGGPSDFGPAGDQFGSSLGSDPSEVLGIQVTAYRPPGKNEGLAK